MSVGKADKRNSWPHGDNNYSNKESPPSPSPPAGVLGVLVGVVVVVLRFVPFPLWEEDDEEEDECLLRFRLLSPRTRTRPRP